MRRIRICYFSNVFKEILLVPPAIELIHVKKTTSSICKCSVCAIYLETIESTRQREYIRYGIIKVNCVRTEKNDHFQYTSTLRLNSKKVYDEEFKFKM